MNQKLIDIGVESYRAFAGKFQSLVPDPNSLLKVSLDDCLETSFWETDTPELQLLGSVFSDLLETLTIVETSLEIVEENLESENESSPLKTNISKPMFGNQGHSKSNLAYVTASLSNQSKKKNTEFKAFPLQDGKGKETQNFIKRGDNQNKQVINATDPMTGIDYTRANEFDFDSYHSSFPAVQRNQITEESNEQLPVSGAVDSDSELANIVYNPSSFQVQPFTSLGNLGDIGDLFGEEETSNEKLPAKVDWSENKQNIYPPRLMPSFTAEKTEWQDDFFDQKAATNFPQSEKAKVVDIDTLLEILAQNLQNDYERYYGD